MREHYHMGQKFRVGDGMTDKDADRYCAELLRYINRADAEPEFLPFDSKPTEAPKKRGRPRKVIAPTVDKITGETVTAVAESTLYAAGFYREPCATCGKGIPLTGKRGRAPKYHAECRPTE